uniref:peroxisome biogenesis protein 3-2 isoform X2 n=1 Tax=Erigeron canadensis TaxID=72917 RepID=UPI001CB973B7|nr:peroxisome biogenesis protein 3-2 isoform X2 [Erigeron canadensis]
MDVSLDFWRRHKRKVYVSFGLCGGGYLLYKFYESYTNRISELERQLADEQENDELLKAQMQVHFENIQRIANTMTLPHAMLYLSSRVAEELDLLHLTERLMKGKGQPNSLTPSEKLELWDRLKILSFTRMVLSIWAMTAISLYIRIQVNILGRHLYIDTARDLGGFHPEDADLINRNDEQQFLASADFLSSQRMPTLISNMQAAATEVLRGKQLRDIFNSTVLHDTIMQILNMFMSMGRPHHWLDYLMPEDVRFYKSIESSGSDDPNISDISKLDQLMVETRTVLRSSEFGNILDLALGKVVGGLMEDMNLQFGDGSLSAGLPLAKLLPRVAQVSPQLLEEPSRNKFTQIIQNIPEVEVFFTLLYTNMSTS